MIEVLRRSLLAVLALTVLWLGAVQPSVAQENVRYAAIVVSSEDQAAAHEIARLIGRAAPEVEGMACYGPAPAPLAMLRGRHRFRLLVHARRALDVQDVIREWLGNLVWPAKVRVTVDVDPYSFL